MGRNGGCVEWGGGKELAWSRESMKVASAVLLEGGSSGEKNLGEGKTSKTWEKNNGVQ